MKKQTKSLVLSALSALALGAVGTTGTFALFTDKAETTIQAQAGIVDINDTLTILSVSELYGESVEAVNGVYTNSVGSKTYIDEDNANLLHLEKWVPGDKAVINMLVENASNVDIRTRMVVSHTTTSDPDLFSALKITYDVKDAGNNDITGMLNEWRTIPASTHVIQNVKITIEFPNHGEEITVREQGTDNGYQDANCAILFSQQAVQGNAHTPTSVDLLNETLEASTTVNPTMYDALKEANITAAYALEKGYVWDSVEDEFLFESEVTPGYRYFKVYEGHMPVLQNFSIYAYDWNNVNVIYLNGVGFDAGDVTGLTQIHYGNDTNEPRTIIVRSNDGLLDVNAPLDTIHHYNYASQLIITAVAGNSYHEHGSVGQAVLGTGRLVVEKDGYIEVLAGFGDNEKTVEIKGFVPRVLDNIEDAVDEEKSTGSYAGHEATVEDGSEIKVYSYEQFQALANHCNEGFTFKGVTLKLMNDLDFTDKVWTPFGRYAYRATDMDHNDNIVFRDSRFFMGNIDGNGHKIVKFSNVGYHPVEFDYEGEESNPVHADANYGLIALATGNVEIKNITVDYNFSAVDYQEFEGVGLIGQYVPMELTPISKVTWNANLGEWVKEDNSSFNRENMTYELKSATLRFSNVKTTGVIMGYDGVAPLLGYNYGGRHPATVDDRAIYQWRSVKWMTESATGRASAPKGKGDMIDIHTPEECRELIENYVKTSGDGWYAEGFEIMGESPELKFTENGVFTALSSGNCCSYAPVRTAYIFQNCENQANSIAANRRAGIFFGKLSNEGSIGVSNLASITLSDCKNSGQASAPSRAGIIAGYYGSNSTCMPVDIGNLVNTGTAKEGTTVYEGTDCLYGH